MPSSRRFAATTAFLGTVAFVHALLTWPLEATIALFAGGAALAFVGEVVVVHLGWLEHHVAPNLFGVPLYVLAGWTAVTYVALRIALLLTGGWTAVVLAAAIATGYDVLTDTNGVESGYWTYVDDLPRPRHGAVPWWNYAGWFVISGGVAAVTVAVLQ